MFMANIIDMNFSSTTFLFILICSCLHLSSNAYIPGHLRRSLFGNFQQRLNLPHEVVNAARSAFKKKKSNPIIDSLPADAAKNAISRSLLPPQPFSDSSHYYPPFIVPKVKSETNRALEELDCLLAQREIRQKPIPSFMCTISPSEVKLDPSDRAAQVEWLGNNASKLQRLKQVHGGILLQGWDLLKDEEGLKLASKALGMNLCQDPAQFLNLRPSLGKGKEQQHVFEASNNQKDAATHIGMHNEVTPGLHPKSALFACFQAADDGGEFLVCDGRRVLRDVDTETLATMQSRKYRAVFAEIPSWLSSAPGPLGLLPFTNVLHQELLSIGFDLSVPTNDYMLAFLPGSKKSRKRLQEESTLAVTSQSASPVVRHHETGEALWYCNIDTAHRGLFEKRNPKVNDKGAFTTNAFDLVHGDGGSISDNDVKNIVCAIDKNTREIAMKPGDGVFLDNFITMHGRKRFSGTRKHAVVWSSN